MYYVLQLRKDVVIRNQLRGDPDGAREVEQRGRRQAAPLQKNASIFPSFNASTDALTLRLCLRMSLSGSRPAALSTRNAITSVPLPGEPVDTTRPFRSASRLMFFPSIVATCV